MMEDSRFATLAISPSSRRSNDHHAWSCKELRDSGGGKKSGSFVFFMLMVDFVDPFPIVEMKLLWFLQKTKEDQGFCQFEHICRFSDAFEWDQFGFVVYVL